MPIKKTEPALFAMPKALEQPKLLRDKLQESIQPEQRLAAQPRSAPKERDVVRTGKRQKINIIS